MIDLSNKVVVITGHSQGIGKAIYEHFQAVGAKVFGLSKPQYDLRDLEQIPIWLNDIYAQTGRIDVLVNNAGVNFIGNIEETTIEDFEELLLVNLKVSFVTMKTVLPWMSSNQFGRVINVASDQAMAAKRYGVAYAASKAGLVQLSRSCAIDYARQGVTVNVVSPGSTRTQMLDDAIDQLKTRYPHEFGPDLFDQCSQSLPLGRYVMPDDISGIVVFLSSSYASSITGSIIPVDGGFTAT
mgnify:CR=1 FL=1